MTGRKDDGSRKRGIESKLTLTRLKNVITALVAGNYVGTACEFVGISRSSYNEWRLRGEKEIDRVGAKRGTNVEAILESFEGKDHKQHDGAGNPLDKSTPEYMWNNRPTQFSATEWPYVVFNVHTGKSRAAAEVRALHMVTSAMGKNWQAAAWYLERTQPDRYGRRERINHEGSAPGSPVQIVSTSELEQKLAELTG